MSVTVADLMKLPCLQEAEVIAGRTGLNRIVSSVSVLEYADVSKLSDELFKNNEFYGSEIVITGFINIKDDVDAQCANIQRLCEAGEVGIILYYVGIFMPEIDQRLIELADRLGFPLICMPKNRMNLRYSEVICEVMEAIYQDHLTETYFVSEILERIAQLPDHQRSMDTVLKMLSDRIRATAVMTDLAGHVLNAAAWPRTLEIDMAVVRQAAAAGQKTDRPAGQPVHLQERGKELLVYCLPIADDYSTGMQLYLLKENEPLKNDAAKQAAELVQLAVRLWSRHHAGIVISELVSAIMKDEPIKMRRLAEIFKIDVTSIDTLWVFVPEQKKDSGAATKTDLQKTCAIVRERLSGRFATFFADTYERNIVAFMERSARADSGELAATLHEQLVQNGRQGYLVICNNMVNTTDVRRSYLAIGDYLDTARLIQPRKKIFSAQEILFAGHCQAVIAQGEQAVDDNLAILAPLGGDGGEAQQDLRNTLAIYLLDAGSSVTQTAEQMFLHKNTIKYRLQRISDKLGFGVDKMPETIGLYLASALFRIIGSS
jgi:DNA-binding PucR family transcriptional regulator